MQSLREPKQRLSTLRHEALGGMGDERLSADDKTEDRRPHKDAADDREGSSTRKRRRPAQSGDVGKALRSIYDDTLREDVPDDFMDLLGKLS